MGKAKKSATLKGLQTQLEKTEAEYEIVKSEVSEIHDRCSQLKSKCQRLRKKIEGMKNRGPVTITEHARLRYLTRVIGFDIEEVDAKIVSDQIQKYVDQLGDGDYPLGDGFYVKIKDNTAITVYES